MDYIQTLMLIQMDEFSKNPPSFQVFLEASIKSEVLSNSEDY